MPSRPVRVVAAFLFAAASAGWMPAPAGAQDPAADQPSTPAEETFYEAIQVRLAEVEVVVTDREGHRVLGLSRDQFALYEDGEPVEITAFAAVGDTPATPAATAGPAGPLASAPARGVDRAGLLLAVLVDNQSLTLATRRRLLPALRVLLLSGLRAEDRVVVATQDSTGILRVALPPSPGGDHAAAALDLVTQQAPGGNFTLSAAQRLIRELERAPAINAAGGSPMELALAESEARRLHADIRVLAEELERQARTTATTIEELVEAVAGLPGRKAVLLVGGGVPTRPAEALYSAWRNRYGNDARELGLGSQLDDTAGDASTVLSRVARRANGNQVTLYAMGSTDVPRLGSAEMASNEAWTGLEEGLATTNLRQSLQLLAGPTGGLASYDAGDPSILLRELRADFDSYYSLAYTPRERRPGKDRALRVTVAQPGVTVRYRDSRRERTGRESMVERTRAALLFGWQDNPLGLGVQLGAPSAGEGRRDVAHQPVTVTLPLSGVVLVPAATHHEGKLTLYLAAGDAAGGSSPVNEVALPIRVPNDQLLAALGQQLGYRTKLALRPKGQRLAVSVRDELGQGMATILVEVPPLEPGAVTGPTAPADTFPDPPGRDPQR